MTRSIESAQRKVEAHNFDIRKHLLEYDDVANDQRKVIYEQRNELLETRPISETITSLRQGVVNDIFSRPYPAGERGGAVGRARAWSSMPRMLASGRQPGRSGAARKSRGRRRPSVPGEISLAPPKALHQFERWVMLSQA